MRWKFLLPAVPFYSIYPPFIGDTARAEKCFSAPFSYWFFGGVQAGAGRLNSSA